MNKTNLKNIKNVFICQQCAHISSKWQGQCPDCNSWNSFEEGLEQSATSAKRGYAGITTSQITPLNTVSAVQKKRISTGMNELDHVLGGGLVSGSVSLIGGSPGIGKSTLLLGATASLSLKMKVLYVTGEESPEQISLRATRMELKTEDIAILAETCVEKIIAHTEKFKPKILIIDSIQTVYSDALSSAPGSVSQVREAASHLVRFAKQNDVAIILVGHVTKDGSIAGPRVLEHMVDTVLYFESQQDSRFRSLRAQKNRFGAVNELGIFAMTEKGLRPVTNPSAIFLTGGSENIAGHSVMVTWEGTRPLLVEIQALVDDGQGGHPRRLTVGLDNTRLIMLLAVLNRHGGIHLGTSDVFINAVGGVKVTETASDLPCLLSVYSSFKDKALPPKTIIFGEIGLSGEIRPVPHGLERIKEAEKHGFIHAIVPKSNLPKHSTGNIQCRGVSTLREALEIL